MGWQRTRHSQRLQAPGHQHPAQLRVVGIGVQAAESSHGERLRRGIQLVDLGDPLRHGHGAQHEDLHALGVDVGIG